ncbi:MAG: GC-type dockerin domain-anchored protein [Planctomycetota bacterium]
MINRVVAVSSVMFVSAHAVGQGFVSPDAFGWTRGDTDSTHHEWDDFTTFSGLNEPDVASSPASILNNPTIPGLRVVEGNGIITSTGNMYSFSGILEWEVTVPTFEATGGTTSVVFQTRTQGNEIDPSTLFANGQAPVETTELYRFDLGGDQPFGGFIVDTLWRFEVPASQGVTIAFAGIASSGRLDKVSVDTILTDAGCPGDIIRDGVVDGSDFFAWVAAFGSNAPIADVNLDGDINGGDFFAWVSAFGAGC